MSKRKSSKSKSNKPTQSTQYTQPNFESRAFVSQNGYVQNGNEKPKFYSNCHRYHKDGDHSSSEELNDKEKEKFLKENRWAPPNVYPSFWAGQPDENVNMAKPQSTKFKPKSKSGKSNKHRKHNSEYPNCFPFNNPFFANMYNMYGHHEPFNSPFNQFNQLNQLNQPFYNPWQNYNPYTYPYWYDYGESSSESESEQKSRKHSDDSISRKIADLKKKSIDKQREIERRAKTKTGSKTGKMDKVDKVGSKSAKRKSSKTNRADN